MYEVNLDKVFTMCQAMHTRATRARQATLSKVSTCEENNNSSAQRGTLQYFTQHVKKSETTNIHHEETGLVKK